MRKTKIPRRAWWMLLAVAILPTAILVERHRRTQMLLGSWRIIQTSPGYVNPSGRLYYVFRTDGTGEMVYEDREGSAHNPFTYRFDGFSHVEITSDTTFCGTEVVSLNSDCLPNDASRERVYVMYVYLGWDSNTMRFQPPWQKPTIPDSFFHREAVEPLPPIDDSPPPVDEEWKLKHPDWQNFPK